MLAYVVRTLPTLARALLRRDGRLVSRLRRRVPLDRIDFNVHMNQAAYAEVGELGRTDWVLRTRAWQRWQAVGVKPVVADQHIVYRRELRPLQAYEIDTRAVAVEGRLLRLDHHLLVGDRVHTRIEVHLIFIGPDGVLPADEARALCEGLLTEPLPVRDWRVAC